MRSFSYWESALCWFSFLVMGFWKFFRPKRSVQDDEVEVGPRSDRWKRPWLIVIWASVPPLDERREWIAPKGQRLKQNFVKICCKAVGLFWRHPRPWELTLIVLCLRWDCIGSSYRTCRGDRGRVIRGLTVWPVWSRRRPANTALASLAFLCAFIIARKRNERLPCF